MAELFPSEAFQVLVPLLESYSQVYFSLQQLLTPGEQGKGTWSGGLSILDCVHALCFHKICTYQCVQLYIHMYIVHVLRVHVGVYVVVH